MTSKQHQGCAPRASIWSVAMECHGHPFMEHRDHWSGNARRGGSSRVISNSKVRTLLRGCLLAVSYSRNTNTDACKQLRSRSREQARTHAPGPNHSPKRRLRNSSLRAPPTQRARQRRLVHPTQRGFASARLPSGTVSHVSRSLTLHSSSFAMPLCFSGSTNRPLSWISWVFIKDDLNLGGTHPDIQTQQSMMPYVPLLSECPFMKLSHHSDQLDCTRPCGRSKRDVFTGKACC